MAYSKVYSTFSVIDGMILQIVPNEEIQDNSKYIIKIEGLMDADGSPLSTQQFTIITAVSPMYCTLKSLNALVRNFGISEEDLLSYIRDASNHADFIENDGSSSSTSSSTTTASFAKEQFTRLKATLDCLLAGCMTKAWSGGGTYKLDLAEVTDPTNATAFKNLIDALRKALREWQDAIRGYVNEGRAKPKATRIGINSSENSDVAHTTVDMILNDWTRTPPEGS